MDELTQTVNLQPAMTAVNLSLLAVMRRAGCAFSTCAGHSLGEYSALHAAGVLTAEDTTRLVFLRGTLMHREAIRNRGAMQAIVGLPIADVDAVVAEAAAEGVVSVANHNAETQIVITGTPDAVARAGAMAAARGAKAIALKVSGAWHSELIRGAEAEFKEALAKVVFRAPEREIVLNVTAEPGADPVEIREVMTRQLCSPVRWYDGMRRMAESGVEAFVEVGPGKVLSGLMRKILPKDSPAQVYNVGSLAQIEAYLKAIA
jgi:[acyl-carrier-protein] S-malonyltransferase